MARDGNAKGMKETKFKDTELGKIPEEWEVCNLGSIGVPLMCKRIMKWQTNKTAGVPFYKIGTFGKQADAFIAPDIWRYMITHFNYPKKGDILISAAGTIGRTVVFDGQPSYFQDSNIVWIDNDEEKVLNPYLEYAYTKIAWSTDASTISRLYNSNLKSALILFPHDKAEQQRIASALSDADALVAELDVLIEKKRSIMAGIMQELLTGKRRLQGYNEKWKESAIEDIGNLIRGVSFDSDSVSTSFFENSIPILRANNIVDGNLFLHDLIFVDKHFVKKHQYHRENDILICSANGSKRLVGKAALIKGDDNISFGAFMTTLRCKNASMALYFSMFMRTDEYRKQINDLLCGSAINNLNSKQLYTIKLKHPSDQAEQHAIATILSDMDAEIAELEAKRDKYKEVRQGMMQQLLTGKIRLI